MFATLNAKRLRQFAQIVGSGSVACAMALSCLAAAMGSVAVTATSAHAADASPWDADTRSAVRLIAGDASGPSTPPGLVRAGIEFKLRPGWITYWRYPGDAGVPPRFDFAGSENLRSATVLWPAPRRLHDEGGNTIGYQGDLVLPLAVVPQDAGRPVTLHLKLDYAVCEKLCVPAEGNMELVLAGEPSTHESALAAAEAHVPKPAAVGDAGTFAVRSVTREPGARTRWPRVVVDIAAPADSTVDLFAEGPSPEWALPLPDPTPQAPVGIRRFVFELDGLPPGVTPAGATLRLTATAGDQAIEVTARLD
jgi:DsbC/DsbD-like thiol-disulfide interchange protein